jgi:hypothetical protein
MRPMSVQVPGVGPKHRPQRSVVVDQHPVSALRPYRPHPAFGITVHHRTPRRDLHLDAGVGQDRVERRGELPGRPSPAGAADWYGAARRPRAAARAARVPLQADDRPSRTSQPHRLRGGPFTTPIPAADSTSSNDPVNCPARSRIRNQNWVARSPRSISRLPGLLGGPPAVRVRGHASQWEDRSTASGPAASTSPAACPASPASSSVPAPRAVVPGQRAPSSRPSPASAQDSAAAAPPLSTTSRLGVLLCPRTGEQHHPADQADENQAEHPYRHKPAIAARRGTAAVGQPAPHGPCHVLEPPQAAGEERAGAGAAGGGVRGGGVELGADEGGEPGREEDRDGIEPQACDPGIPPGVAEEQAVASSVCRRGCPVPALRCSGECGPEGGLLAALYAGASSAAGSCLPWHRRAVRAALSRLDFREKGRSGPRPGPARRISVSGPQ